ncbi:hypothetical protein AJ78_04396 [Emergomyces pasteurianus Ep9510]|uniref:Uncharacterized protein n=1 Tax=Emergomyces pasteurianus Ep9510 TaxID=1447872 RepID=A0A1J9QGQ3_9EURO|nr:hypothetical protein AJ78_04396 [Emergomyces pasteurianus Ep9510]
MRWVSFSLYYFGLVSLCAVETIAASVRPRTNFNELVDNLNLPRDLNQFTHIGSDGILRVFSTSAKVLGFVRLTNQQLGDFIDERRDILGMKEAERMRGIWGNADSSKVDESQIWHPSPELLPKVFSENDLLGVDEHDLPKDITPAPAAVVKKRSGEDRCRKYRCHYNSDCHIVNCFGCYHYEQQLGHC